MEIRGVFSNVRCCGKTTWDGHPREKAPLSSEGHWAGRGWASRQGQLWGRGEADVSSDFCSNLS